MAATGSFTHLHTHTEYSMLDGASRLDDLVAAAVADGQPALGITDHGNMYGVLDFYAACRNAGINPVIGTEAYMAGESRHERPVRRGKVDDTGGDVEGGREALLPPDAAGRDHPGLPEPPQALVGRLPRGLLLQAPRRLGAPRTPPRGHHRHHRLPRRRRAPGTAGRRRGARPQAGGPPPGRVRARQPVRGAPGPRPAPTDADQPRAGPHRPPARRPAARHQRQPLHPPRGLGGPRRTAVRADRCPDRRPQALQVRRGGALPEVGARRCGRCSPSSPKPATTRSSSPSGPTSRSSSA